MLPAAGMFCTMTVGLPGMCFGQVLGKQAAAGVVVAADRVADDHADLLVLVEIGLRLRACGMPSARPMRRAKRRNVAAHRRCAIWFVCWRSYLLCSARAS